MFHEGDPATTRQTLALLPIERDGHQLKGGTPTPLIGGAFLKANARISADGKWMAYAANDTGTFEIYVQSFPELGERVQVSNGGGNLALWAPRKNELYYSGASEGTLMMVPFTVSNGAFVPAKPRPWSQTHVFLYAPDSDVWPRLRPAPRRRALRRHTALAVGQRRDGCESSRAAVQFLRRAAPRCADSLIGASATSAGIHDMHMTDIPFRLRPTGRPCPPPDTKALRASRGPGEQCTAAGFVCVWLRSTPGSVADHWCTKGHILLCLEGELQTEIEGSASIRADPGHELSGRGRHRAASLLDTRRSEAVHRGLSA